MSRFPETTAPWAPVLNWDCRPGKTLQQLAMALDPELNWAIDVFESAPLELAFGADFVSADIDTIFPLLPLADVELILERHGFLRGLRPHYVQPCPSAAFRTSSKWKDRAYSTCVPDLGHVRFRFAHPIDIILGKLNRLDEKDWRAIRTLRQQTGGPEENVLLYELQEAPELFSLAFMTTFGKTFRDNVEELWLGLYGREIEVELEILKPARIRHSDAYNQ